MRFIGRLESEASPISRLLNGWAASTPAISRMAVPEFPHSSGSSGAEQLAARPVHAQLRFGGHLDDAAHGLQRAHGAEAILARQGSR